MKTALFKLSIAFPRYAAEHSRACTRAKRAVVCAIVTVLALHVMLVVVLETRKTQWRDPEYGHRLNRLKPIAHWAKANGHPMVVVMGSSRVEMGFVPEHINTTGMAGQPAVFNFSQSGCGPVGQLLNLQRLIDANIPMDYVCIEVLRPLWGETGNVNTQVGNEPHKYTLADFQLLSEVFPNASPQESKYWASRSSAVSTFRLNLLQHAGLEQWLPSTLRTSFLWKSMTPLGAMPYYAPQMPLAERQQRTSLAHQQYYERLQQLKIHTDVQQAYAEIAKRCRERNIRLAFFVMPESDMFRTWYPENQLLQLKQMTLQLGIQHRVPVFDCSEWYGQENQFIDGHHLEGTVAEQFSKRFGHECLTPWLASQR